MAVYVQINCVPSGSTGNIMLGEHKMRQENGDTSYVFWGRGRDSENEGEWKFANEFGCKSHALLDRITGKHGFYSSFSTRKMLKRLDEIEPDVVHLHNIHGYYVNIPMLFEWLANHDCKVEWTLHDCWAFTGHCSHFTYVKCEQWKTHCACSEKCPQLHSYPKTFSLNSCRWNFEQKKRYFTLVSSDRMKLITPSQWLADLVGESFLSKYPVEVRHNTINTSVFKPTQSDFRDRFGIGDRFMVLGVAFPWNERKGLSDFIRLANELDSSKFAVVLVGLTKKQASQIRQQIVAVPKLEDKKELAEAYSAADVFVHPGVEETFGMTVAEAQACGTTVVVTKGSACAEIAKNDASIEIPPDLSTLKATIINMRGGGMVIVLPRTDNKNQLAAIYSSADVFFNPTMEDNYPTVNLESEACGTPVITYDTGGCAETIKVNASMCVTGFDEVLSRIRFNEDLV